VPPAPAPAQAPAASAERNEFQDFVAQSLGRELPLYGYNLFRNVPSTFAPLDRIPVTSDYVIGPGDELVIRAWGQVDIDYRVTVDRNGAISIPRIGNINVAGMKFQELQPYLKSAVGRVFANFDLNVTMGQLRSIQVFVVGQASRPGTYTVSSLSTLVNAVFASGGPTLKGSMRRIQLRRGNRLITEFDMYDLLLKGDKSKDMQLLPGDVIYIPPTGQLAAISGSVNTPAIYEIKGRARLADLIELAGGLNITADGQKVAVERIVDRKTRRVEDLQLDRQGLAREIHDGDLVQVLPLSPRFDNAVTLKGNVAVPARVPWREGLRIKDIVPDREALIVPDYYLRRNFAIRADAAARVTGQVEERLRTDVRRTLAEVNWDYAVIERLNFTDVTTLLIPFNLGKAVLEGDPQHNLPLQPGDVITIFSKDDIRVPVAKQNHFVRLEGEVAVAGIYQTRPGETLRQLVARVGGLSQNAYLFGAEFTRESTRVMQQRRMEEIIDRLEQSIQRNLGATAKTALSTEEATSAKVSADGQMALVARLRRVRATGRIVLEIAPEETQFKNLPDLVLEDGDRFIVPPRPSTVAVAGTVYNENAFIYRPDKRLTDYLAQAGGPTRDADNSSLYLIRADGSVISRRQSGYFISNISGVKLMPGDTIVVPEELDKFRLSKELKDWSQIFYQFALGAAGLKVLRGL
jgi:protein involved in polysaccharide export with SLBB domain